MVAINISAYSDPIGIRKNLQQIQVQINDRYVPYTGAIMDVDLGAYDLTATDITATGDIILSSSGVIYLGSKTTDGTWKLWRDGDDLLLSRRESGVWVDKGGYNP